jgi:hypothetical protein
MKGIRFYQEFPDKQSKRKNVNSDNCIAVNIDRSLCWYSNGHYEYEAIGSVFDYANSPVATTNVHSNYLRENCKRILESKARTIHPELFKYLDAEE